MNRKTPGLCIDGTGSFMGVTTTVSMFRNKENLITFHSLVYYMKYKKNECLGLKSNPGLLLPIGIYPCKPKLRKYRHSFFFKKSDKKEIKEVRLEV